MNVNMNTNELIEQAQRMADASRRERMENQRKREEWLEKRREAARLAVGPYFPSDAWLEVLESNEQELLVLWYPFPELNRYIQTRVQAWDGTIIGGGGFVLSHTPNQQFQTVLDALASLIEILDREKEESGENCE